MLPYVLKNLIKLWSIICCYCKIKYHSSGVQVRNTIADTVTMDFTSGIIKQEEDQNIHEDEIQHNIKWEVQMAEDTTLEDHNPFQNVQLEVKHEVSSTIEQEIAESQDEDSISGKDDEYICGDQYIQSVPHIEPNCGEKSGMKEETVLGDDSLVTYDYPNFGDEDNDENDASLDCNTDSNEAEALTRVEACLYDIKHEIEGQHEAHQKEEYLKMNIKEESDITVTETHLISNKLINTTSTVTNTHDGLIESQTTKTLVMEIHPMSRVTNIPFTKNSNPEEILPTPYSNDDCMDYQDSFQLNSITGNVLSLEQEAYSLLKAKRKKDSGGILHMCPKCPKTYTQKKSLNVHLQVHASIEKRALGIIKGQKTRKKNRNMKLKEEAASVKQDKAKKEIVPVRKGKIEKEDVLPKRDRAKRKTVSVKQDKFKQDNVKQDKVKKHKVKRHKVKQDKIKEEDISVKEEEDVKKEGSYICTCGQVFQRRSRMETCLRAHNMFSDNDAYPCVTCSKQFKNKEELALHRKRLHRKRFPCKFCPTDYHTRKELFRHLQIHQKVQLMEYKAISEVVKGKQKLKCFMCSKSFKEMPDLKSHVMDDHKEPYTCPRCKQTFSKIIDFGQHTKTFHPEVEGQSVLNVLEAFSKLVKAWKCEECGLQFHEADKLAMHKIEKHSPELKAEPQFQCTDCQRVFVSQKGLTSHRRVHHSTEVVEETETVETGVMCLECRKMCKDMNSLASHTRFHSLDRKYPCKFCDFRFATSEKRKIHAEIHTGDMKYVCFICEYQCSSENRLKQHKMSLKHLNMKEFLLTGKPLIEEEQSTSKQEKIKDTLEKKEWTVKKKRKKESSDSSSDCSEVACDICGDKFPNESVMLEHKQTHPFIEFPNDDKPSRIFFK